MSLEGLSQLLTVMCSKGVDQLCHFLSSLDDVMRDSDQQAIIHHYIRHFQVCCLVDESGIISVSVITNLHAKIVGTTAFKYYTFGKKCCCFLGGQAQPH